jgi:hypothetical protein
MLVLANFMFLNSFALLFVGRFDEFASHEVFRHKVDNVDIYHAVLFVTACEVLLHMGALLASRTNAGQHSSFVCIPNGARYRLALAAKQCLVLTFPCVLLTAFTAASRSVTEGYGAMYDVKEGGLSAYIQLLGGGFVCASSALLACAQFRVQLARIAWALSAVVLVLYLGAGFRTFPLMLLCALLYIRHSFIRPFSMRDWLLLGSTAFVVSSIVVVIRSASGLERFSAEGITTAVTSSESSWIEDRLCPFGETFRAVAVTVDSVPDRRDYEMGKTFLWGTIVPFPFAPRVAAVFWDVPESPAIWLTRQVSEREFRQGRGMGFSHFAEAYLNFGRYGALMYLILGWLLGRGIFWAHSDRSDSWVGGLLQSQIIGALIFWTRGELAHVSRPVVMGLLLLSGLYWLNGRRLNQRSRVFGRT